MIIKAIPSTWLIEEEHRLDCGPFVKGQVEARKIIEGLLCPKDPLVELTKDGMQGMYHVGQDKIRWATDSVSGMPFLGSTDILKADVSLSSFISRKQVANEYLFQCPPGSTLISRSGTIGRMAFMRVDMEDTAISQDVLKVVPDPNKVPPGYLYAFLNSKFGLPLVTGGTFGSIIVHIEAENIANILVPRLNRVEVQAHDLIQLAANKRVEANDVIQTSIDLLTVTSGMRRLTFGEGIGLSTRSVSSSSILSRMDGAYHSHYHREVLETLDQASIGTTTVAELSRAIVEPKRFKRIEITDAEFGIPMFGTTALMWSDPQPSYLIPKSMQGIEELLVDKKMLLIPRSGQISGIIGTAVLPYGGLIGGAVSEDAIRIQCATETTAGYLFVFLRSEYGRRQLKARAFGSSIPHLDIHQIGKVLVPDLGSELVKKIGAMGIRSARLRHEAIEHEKDARSLVEHAIESGGR
jgi:type I restriction enzyme S subunit